MNQVAIELRNISKRFGRIQANKDVNLSVYNGEILALLGENGSGKTTLMNMISGIYHPDEGQIIIDGEAVSVNSPHDAFNYKIGMMYFNYYTNEDGTYSFSNRVQKAYPFFAANYENQQISADFAEKISALDGVLRVRVF